MAIMMDTKGPEVRVGVLANPIELKKGERLTIRQNPKEGEITLEPFDVIQDVKEGGNLLFLKVTRS